MFGMKVKTLQLIHFRSTRQTSLDFEDNLNVLIGINGAGKTTVLDALAIMLSWALARVRSSGSRGRVIRETDIHNEKTFARLELRCEDGISEPADISWRLVQARKGRNPELDSSDPLYGMTTFIPLNQWAVQVRESIGQTNAQCNLPVCVYYPVNRAVLDIPLRIRKAHCFDLLEAYDEALTGGANFRVFFEWFRNREDLENEQKANGEAFQPDPQLQAVRRAILAFLPEFSNVSIRRQPLRMEVTKGNDVLRVDQLSDGEKCLFAMVGDLARRLAIANPERREPLQGEGIVLIDEVELHLHPAWQRMVVRKLTETFPNCQFIITTHTPQVLGEVDAHCIRQLSVVPVHGLVCTFPEQSFGLDASEILEEIMEAPVRNAEIADLLSEIFRLIDEDNFEEARRKIVEVRGRVGGSIPDLVHAESLMTMLEPVEGAECESH